MVTAQDVKYLNSILSDEDIQTCIQNAHRITPHIKDRGDLHPRDYLERYINNLMGEVAEIAVIKWLNKNGKYAVSAVDKTSTNPDLGHDIWVKDRNGNFRKCSVKSSLSAKKDIGGILETFTLAITESEVRDINIQVYFWLEISPPKGKPRTTVPSLSHMAIICWAVKNDIDEFKTYNHENRPSTEKKLNEFRTMDSLLQFLSE